MSKDDEYDFLFKGTSVRLIRAPKSRHAVLHTPSVYPDLIYFNVCFHCIFFYLLQWSWLGTRESASPTCFLDSLEMNSISSLNRPSELNSPHVVYRLMAKLSKHRSGTLPVKKDTGPSRARTWLSVDIKYKCVDRGWKYTRREHGYKYVWLSYVHVVYLWNDLTSEKMQRISFYLIFAKEMPSQYCSSLGLSNWIKFCYVCMYCISWLTGTTVVP